MRLGTSLPHYHNRLKCKSLRHLKNFVVEFQIRREQVDQGSQQAQERFDQRRNFQFKRSPSATSFDEAKAFPASAHGPRLRLREESQLFPAR